MKQSTKENMKYWVLRIMGAALAGFAVSAFFGPNKIVSGGVSGLAVMIYHLTTIPASVTLVLVNVFLIILGARTLGKAFIMNTAVGVALLSLFTEIFSHLPALTENVLLASVFGGVCYGIGLGIVFATGSTSGGTDILSRLIQHKFPQLPIGTVLMIVDGIIISFSLIMFRQVDLALFGIIALFISSYSINWLIRRLNFSVIAFVITDFGDVMAEKMVSESPRGVTILKAVGAYTKEDKRLLFCALKEREAAAFQRRVEEIDPSAFVVFSESQKIWGNGFYIYQ